MSTAPWLVGDTLSTGVVSAGSTVGSGVRVIAVFERFAVTDRRVVVRRLSGLDGPRLRGRQVAGSVLRRGPIGVLARAAAGVPRTDVLWDVDAGTGSLLVSARPGSSELTRPRRWRGRSR